ncbi:CHAT domain-containing protein [Leptolyngbya cf. ectocarpi LEGE 11479]|uniref:CHAT domain-containing protein n=1 Tax=Leptolyngbya cf. ectocarpi LEGE 11479 TaxID=1828722 RepID=A0A928ZUY6_LEPEC|nr:CHAT domain-containing protein [Leptolyngbya ectocarpi]MBE9067952.1 CHAT domain-containing protein [Leptolyngbya cf. ectocarpi LEGE 11479]
MAATTCVNAQVVSAQDSIQTQVVQQDNQIDIFGGTSADNATLLFHSFEQFDLEQGHTAEFHVAPSVHTVFSRITNGAPSHINGRLEITGSPAGLYLINPAGVLFGSEASLNLAGDFTVLTAEQLDFSQGHFGLGNYPGQVQGNVLQLHFNPKRPSTITNLGDLGVNAAHALSLIGHSVVNRGILRGGAINIAAVGGHRNVALTGGLQFATPTDAPQALPPWLTPAGTEHASAIEIDPNGALKLTGAQLSELPSGTVLVGGELTALGLPGRIQILGDHIATADAALQTANGGQVLIGGDYQGQGSLPTAQSVFIDATSTIRADALDTDALDTDNQNGGQVVIWSDRITQFRGAISAQGIAAGGTVEVSGKEQLYFGGQVDLRSQGTPGTLLLDPENIEIRAGSDPGSADTSEPQVLYENTLETSIIGNTNLILQADNDITIAPLSDGVLTFPQGTAGISFVADADGDGQGRFTMAPGDRLSTAGQDIQITAADITVSDLTTSSFSTIDNFESAGEIRLTATRGNIVGNNLTSTARGTLNNSGNAGDVILSASDAITVGTIDTTASALNNNGSAGGITLNAQTGSVTAGVLNANISGNNNTGTGGDININAAGSISTDNINTSIRTTTNNSGNAGAVTLASRTENIATASISTDTTADSSNTGDAGPISLQASQGSIISQQITATTVSPDLAATQGGDVELDADGNIILDFINVTGQGQGGTINITTQQSFQSVNSIPNISPQISLLTTDDGTINLTYNSDGANPFSIGNSRINGTVGAIVTGVETLAAPQTVDQSLTLKTITINNLFEAAPSLQSLSQENSINSPALVDISVDISMETSTPLPTSTDSLTLAGLEILNALNTNESGLSGDHQGDDESILSNSELIWAQIEMAFSTEFTKALDLPLPAPPSLQTTQETLRQIANTQNITPALMYVRLKNTHVELVLVSGERPPVYYPVDVTAAEIQPVIDRFHETITNPVLRPVQYLPAAQQLYDWLVRPMADDLAMANVDHIGFILDAGLRSLPMAALHDGEQFLIESYSLGLLPSVGLTPIEPSLQSFSKHQQAGHGATLAMGIANFDNQADLAAVPFELDLASQSHNDEQYLDHEATLAALQQRLEQGEFTNVHLATHAVFQPGSLDTSYVQLWDHSINLTQLQELPLDAVDFLILSACATALGDRHAEFGFAGLAVKVGVQTALASLWSISDEGTLGLMAEFYRALEQPLTRSAALRQAQLAMLQGKVSIMDGTVYGSGEQTIGHLPSLDASGSWNFSHPAYWSGFTMIGNPW